MPFIDQSDDNYERTFDREVSQKQALAEVRGVVTRMWPGREYEIRRASTDRGRKHRYVASTGKTPSPDGGNWIEGPCFERHVDLPSPDGPGVAFEVLYRARAPKRLAAGG
jgi:hypothetical protein